MHLSKSTVDSLKLANSASTINDQVYKKLLENCMSVLCGRAEKENLASICTSKADVVKEFYAALLTATLQFARNNFDAVSVADYLENQCNYTKARAAAFSAHYGQTKADLQLRLVNIGSHLPHIVGIDWTIDYVVKSSNLDQAGGPLFRIALKTEKYDSASQSKKAETVNFVCTAQELQELVYKMKDCARHCQRLTADS